MITFIFGDSITQGYWDSKGGWADRLKAHFFKKDIDTNFHYYHGIHNLGVDGNTTQQVIDRFKNEVETRLWPGSDYAFIFAVGTNDTIHRGGQEYISDADQYFDQLDQLVKLANEYSNKIAFVNLLPVNEKLTNPLLSSSTGKCFTNDRIEDFNQRLELFCSQQGVTLIDVRTEYLDSDYNTLFADGLHPNDEGHEVIYNKVKPVLESWLYPRP